MTVCEKVVEILDKEEADLNRNIFEGVPAEDMPLAILVAFASLILLIVLIAVIFSCL